MFNKKELVNQPSALPTNKLFAIANTEILLILIEYVAKLNGIEFSNELNNSFNLVLPLVVGYFVKNTK